MRDQLRVFGIDIIGGSVRSRSRRPQYALVRMSGDTVTAEDEVSAFRLFRMLATEQPDILAVDSIQEISADQRELFSFMQALPPATRLVQVTGGDRKESLVKVASRYNISFNRLDPFDEARTIARVASLGAGAEVIAFENSCDVVVTRHRSPGKGGWSQNRYVRKIHGAVQQRGREIEMDLTAAGIRYEKKEIKAFGGSSKVSFRVFAAREKLPVTTYRGADVQVRISGRKLDRITFRPVSARPKYLIVGIDPGTTTAVAALDLEGNLLYLNSSRQTSLSDVTGSLYKVGKPLVVASDVRDMPFSVEKIRRTFNAIGYSPRQDVPVDEKTGYTAPYHYANDHERDALSAALEAYRHYKNKFQHVTRRVPPGHDLDEVKAGLIRGLSLEQVLGEIKVTKPKTALPEVRERTDPKTDERVRVLDGMVKRLRGYVQELQEGLQEKDHEIVKLQSRIRKIRSTREAAVQKESEILKRDTVILSLKKRLHREERSNRNLRKRIERQKKIEEIAISGDSIPVRILPALTKDAIRALSEDPGIAQGDVLYLVRTDGWGSSSIRELKDLLVGAVISGPGNPSVRDPQLYRACLEHGIPLLNGLEIPVLIRGRIGIAKKDTFESCRLQWDKEFRDFEADKKARQIEDLFKHYQTERGKEMKKIG
jgi:predicted RNase H-like nuclease (RuvC/YqgF family)